MWLFDTRLMPEAVPVVTALPLADVLPLVGCALTLTVATFVLLQVLDVVSTLAAQARGAQEANPLVCCLQRHCGPVAGLVLCKLLMLVLLALLVLWQGWPSVWVWALLDAVYLVVFVNNLRTLAAQEGSL